MWNALEAYPTFILGVDPNAFRELPQPIAIGTTRICSCRSTTPCTTTTALYHKAMGGGDAYEWSTKMNASIDKIAASAPNFRSYTAPGFQHCILPYPNFYEMTSNGVRLIDWINDVVADKDVQNVSCEPNCGAPNPNP
jgi:hypothetical protein